MGLSSIMDIKAQIISADDKKQWHDQLSFFASKGLGDIYFLPEYVSLYAKGDSVAEAFIYEEGDKRFFFPYLKSRIKEEFSREELYDLETAYGYGGPLVTSEDKDFLKNAWKYFIEHCNRSDIIAGFVRFHPLLSNNLIAKTLKEGSVVFSNQVVVLSLDRTESDIWNNYEKNTRNKVRKAEKKGVSIVSGESSEDLEIFRKLYYSTMGQLGASDFYYFNNGYFSNIARDLGDSFKVYRAQAEGRDIGAALVFFSKDYVLYHLSANIREFRSFEPATFLRHEVIKDSLKSGRRSILFGGGRSSDPNDTLYKFKAGFSKERADFYIGKLLFNKKAYQAVCRTWEEHFPDKVDKFGKCFLKYKF